jgi:glutaredoxin-like YruB-family protein
MAQVHRRFNREQRRWRRNTDTIHTGFPSGVAVVVPRKILADPPFCQYFFNTAFFSGGAEIKDIHSYAELNENLNGLEKTYLLLYKSGSELSTCALENINKAAGKLDGSLFLQSDVTQVKDIHGVFNIDSVPALLIFENGKYVNVIKGCHEDSFFDTYFNSSFHRTENNTEPNQKSVVVYSTPTCGWCKKLKSYLNANNIKYSEIDVSRDQHAMDELVRKSGQMGVPQTDIGGEIIVGFDKTRIDTLLNIKA